MGLVKDHGEESELGEVEESSEGEGSTQEENQCFRCLSVELEESF